MNENLTEIVCIIDRSTSIRTSGLIKSTIEGFNSFLTKQKTEPGEAKMTVVLFDGNSYEPETAYEVRYDGEPMHLIEELNDDNFVPKGMTALYDAIGKTIDMIKTRVSNTPNEERPGKTIVAIMTDGEENSSREYTKASVKTMIETMEKEYNWAFLFLGAGIDAMAEGGSLNVSRGNTLSYANTAGATQQSFMHLSNISSKSRSMSPGVYAMSKDMLMADELNENADATLTTTTDDANN
jgi:uncharacterized protein YegL